MSRVGHVNLANLTDGSPMGSLVPISKVRNDQPVGSVEQPIDFFNNYFKFTSTT
jgi:hypothetical protein